MEFSTGAGGSGSRVISQLLQADVVTIAIHGKTRCMGGAFLLNFCLSRRADYLRIATLAKHYQWTNRSELPTLPG
jgi:hypothetical protein